MTKPFKILGIQQIAIGGEDKNRLRQLWVDLLGFEYKSTFVSERETWMKTFVLLAKVLMRLK